LAPSVSGSAAAAVGTVSTAAVTVTVSTAAVAISAPRVN
jgi:hypothetical protein